MTSQSAHDRLSDVPFWTVQSVFDPEGGGADFAYTIGLHDRGLPELHMWARPDRGEDPGDDWMLSMRDRALLLNELARRLLDGGLAVGQTLTRVYDDGGATLELQIRGPGDRDALEAFGTDRDAVIWAVSWSLARPPEGPNGPLKVSALEQAAADFRAAVAGLDREFMWKAPPGWQVPDRPTYDPGQVFGPRTPIVLARAAQFWQAGASTLNLLLHCATHVEMSGSLTLPISVARTAARAVGRRPALDRLQAAVDELVVWLTEGELCRARWEDLLRSLWGGDLDDRRKRATAQRTSAGTLSDVLLGCLTVEAVADVLDEEWLLAGRGPFLAALGRPFGELPGPEWAASSQVVSSVVELLRPLPAQRLGALAQLHRFARTGRVQEWEAYPEVFAKLHGWSLVGAAACPWASALALLPGWRPLVAQYAEGGAAVELAPLPALQEWASCVTAAISHRARLSDDEVHAFVEPTREVLPGLADLINEPIVMGGS